MPKIWTESGNVHETPNRNNFDLSRQNHLTMKMGGLYPVMCQPVVPGDSFDIKAAFGLKFSPLVFPVQSRMRAHMHFFYVRNKNIWENWQNYISQLEEHEHPYIEQPSDFFKTGSLSDYLGVPTTQTGFTKCAVRVTTPPLDLNQPVRFRRGVGSYLDSSLVDISIGTTTDENGDFISNNSSTSVTRCSLPFLRLTPAEGMYQWNELVAFGPYSASSPVTSQMVFFPRKVEVNLFIDGDGIRPLTFYGENLDKLSGPVLALWINRPGQNFSTEGTLNLGAGHSKFFLAGSFTSSGQSDNSFTFTPLDGEQGGLFQLNLLESLAAGYECYFSIISSDDSDFHAYNEYLDIDDGKGTVNRVRFYNQFQYVGDSATVNDRGLKPFGSEVPSASGQRIKINALPYRAYESIYHCFYRNQHGNQPFYINGVEQFNRYNTTLADGADTTPYHLFYRNYELDYLTSALQSPQQGVAPMVGVSALGNVTISDQNGITTAKAEVDSDGNISNVILTSPAASADHARVALSLATSGFSINDFRGTNALQKWLEMNLRRGYKYIDFIKGHFGQEPHYDSLNMPEFIGGFSQDVQVNMISSTADTSGTGGLLLGDYVGQANCFGGSGHQIRKYCDDYGYIIGILCVVPTPAYTQLLPKYFLHNQPLDYYFPEFRNLGLMPITYREVCPNQSYSEYLASSGEEGNNQDTFGYQRPNYDMVGQTDEVHGEFRSTLKNFLVNRIFEERPQLGTEFLTINPSEVNNIFSVQSPDEDTIFGQVLLDVKAKRPVPRVVVPNLG